MEQHWFQLLSRILSYVWLKTDKFRHDILFPRVFQKEKRNLPDKVIANLSLCTPWKRKGAVELLFYLLSNVCIIIRRRLLIYTFRPLYPRRKCILYSFHSRPGRPQNSPGQSFGNRAIVKIKPPFQCCSSHNLLSMPTALQVSRNQTRQRYESKSSQMEFKNVL